MKKGATEKTCRICGETKPLEAFSSYKGRLCNMCGPWQQRKMESIMAEFEAKFLASIDMKRCTKCSESKPLAAFYYHRTRGHYEAACKECTKERSLEYHYENRDRILERHREYWVENRERFAKKSKEWRERNWDHVKAKQRENYEAKKEAYIKKSAEWREENRERYREHLRAFYRRHRDKVRAQHREYRKANREKLREKNRRYYWAKPHFAAANRHKYRARKKAAPGVCTAKDVVRIWHSQNGHCYWCGVRCGSGPNETSSYHLDHITPLARGGSNHPRNLCVACPSCNCSKGDKYPIEFKLYRRRLGS